MSVGSPGQIRSAVRRRLDAGINRRAAAYPEARLGDSLIVVAPHPDDEVLGCGGLIHRKRAAGASVGIVILTDGSASHGRFIGAEELRKRRSQEALEAALRLGVDEADVTLVGLPDGHLSEHLSEATAALVDIFLARQPAEIALPHRDEPPADHRAAWAACRRAAAVLSRVTLLEYGVWIWRTWPIVPLREGRPISKLTGLLRSAAPCYRLGRAFNRSLAIDQCLDVKRSALSAHATQMSRPPDMEGWPVLGDVDGGAWLDALLKSHEYYRESSMTGGLVADAVRTGPRRIVLDSPSLEAS